ncbi:hypothetical protein I3842_09G097100 [Carya illinoinensis]|uniref:PGG domain-containing protein n=1 Tax=Carya illinoinensis TaxID=32201 RepID=A0A922J5I8_CARIL|nr:hypothetical protein I3842_09G097100 [Carya illinoinensis]
MRNHLGETALFRSVRYGNKKIFNFLAEKIDGYKEDHTKQLFLQRSDKTTILHVAILAQHFDLAHDIASKFEHLVGERDADGMTGLQLLSCNPGAFRREGSLKLAKFLIERDFSWEATYPAIDQSKPRLHKYGGAPSVDRGVGQGPQLMSTALGQGDQPETATPLFLATKSGCVDIAEKILEVYPQAVEHIDDKGRNILHVAIKYRQEKIFQLVQKLELPMKRLVRKVDNDGNSILHTVGIKVEDYTPEELRGPAYQLREEMQWFELVYTVTPPHFRDHRNNMNLTAEGWLKRTAEGCTVVAVLIATVAFAAAYTVPGGPNSQTGAPLLANKPLFVVFTVTDVLSLSFALTSVVIFLSIVTSPFRLSNFRESLLTKLMLAFTFLFLSVSMMMIAFAATVLLMIQKRESWTKVILYALSFLPVGIFALSYFPLYPSLAESFKYLLKKLRQAMPTNLFHGYRNRSNHRQIDQNGRLETQNRCCQLA